MFEKEAEEYREKEKDKGYYWVTQEMEQSELDTIIDESFKDGAEFGYNKANEWHYVKDGDLPKDDKQYLVLFYYNDKGKTIFTCGVRDNLQHDFEIHRCYTEQIVAWKEIVLPKESE